MIESIRLGSGTWGALDSPTHEPLTVFVKELALNSTPNQVCDLFEINGLVPVPLHVRVVESGTKSFAFCLLATPELCRRALATRFLLGSKLHSPTISKASKKGYPLSLGQCESLLNHHLPLQWSSKADVKPIRPPPGGVEGAAAKQRAIISVSLFAESEPVVSTSLMFEQQGEADELIGELKRAVTIATHQAMGKIELLFLGGTKPVMRRL
ncbi:hypothetical protein BASA81_003107 [Batrachochytrium salamandrivorans]|nr:hypothetical protein BASA81_003107 [Batrachochytrium salamandrivorans]